MLQPGCATRQRSEDVCCWAGQRVVEHLMSMCARTGSGMGGGRRKRHLEVDGLKVSGKDTGNSSQFPLLKEGVWKVRL